MLASYVSAVHAGPLGHANPRHLTMTLIPECSLSSIQLTAMFISALYGEIVATPHVLELFTSTCTVVVFL